jgi:hypothetical protein
MNRFKPTMPQNRSVFVPVHKILYWFKSFPSFLSRLIICLHRYNIGLVPAHNHFALIQTVLLSFVFNFFSGTGALLDTKFCLVFNAIYFPYINSFKQIIEVTKFQIENFERTPRRENIHTLLYHLLQFPISFHCQIFWSDMSGRLKIVWECLDSKLDMVLGFDRDWRLFCETIRSLLVAKAWRAWEGKILGRKVGFNST